MRDLKLAAPLALLMLLMLPQGAGAVTVTQQTCTATALVQPILAPPSCTTPAVTCRAGHTCNVSGDLTVSSLVGKSAGRMFGLTLEPPDDPVLIGECGPAPKQCSDSFAGPDGVAEFDFRLALRCEWVQTGLAVLDRVGCSIVLRDFGVQ